MPVLLSILAEGVLLPPVPDVPVLSPLLPPLLPLFPLTLRLEVSLTRGAVVVAALVAVALARVFAFAGVPVLGLSTALPPAGVGCFPPDASGGALLGVLLPVFAPAAVVLSGALLPAVLPAAGVPEAGGLPVAGFPVAEGLAAGVLACGLLAGVAVLAAAAGAPAAGAPAAGAFDLLAAGAGDGALAAALGAADFVAAGFGVVALGAAGLGELAAGFVILKQPHSIQAHPLNGFDACAISHSTTTEDIEARLNTKANSAVWLSF